MKTNSSFHAAGGGTQWHGNAGEQAAQPLFSEHIAIRCERVVAVISKAAASAAPIARRTEFIDYDFGSAVASRNRDVVAESTGER